jgi:hypothetical protein
LRKNTKLELGLFFQEGNPEEDMHKQCPNCQQLLDENARFCPICGSSVSEVKPLDSPIEISQEQLPPPLIPDSSMPEPAVPPESPPYFPQASPAADYVPPPAAPMNLMKPALLAGVILGVASSLPIVSCCCWLWVIAGGVLAVYLLRQETPEEIGAGLGAKLGFMTGMMGAAVWEVMSLPLAFIAQSSRGMEQIQEILKTENLPPESMRMVEWVMQFINQPFHPLILFIGVVSKLIICALFTTMGGLLGVAFFGKPKKR